MLRNSMGTGATMTGRNNRKKSQLVGNVASHCLYRKGKVVTTVERVFNVILVAHKKLKHAPNNSTNKSARRSNLGTNYGVPKTVVHCFIDTCPVVQRQNKTAAIEYDSTKKVGGSFQIDLTEMPECHMLVKSVNRV
jgi:hypothetical protein